MMFTQSNAYDQSLITAEVNRMASAGLSLHWLHEGTKHPIAKGWHKAPKKNIEELLITSHKSKFNIGCRTGQWSGFSDNSCLVVLDVDLKGGEDYRETALTHVKKILGDDLSIYPHVNSPRGIHYYARCQLADLPASQGIASSEKTCEIEMVGKIETRRCWEVDFLSTGKQIVIPPSIHPDTKTAYQWGKRFESFTDIPLLPAESLLNLKKKHDEEALNNSNSTINSDLSAIDIENITIPLKLPEKLKTLIIEGAEKGTRSEAIFSVVTQLIKLEVSEQNIVSILTDTRYKISEKPLEKGNRKKAAEWVVNYCIKPAKKEIKINDSNSSLKLVACNITEFINMKLPPRELILSPWLPKAGLCMIHARPGIGKTHLSFGIAYAVAIGGSFLKWNAEKPRGVLVIDGELSAPLAQDRWKLIQKIQGEETACPLQFVTPDLQEGGMPDLATKAGQDAINALITDQIELIIVDNLSCLIRTGNENEAETWVPVQTWALNLRAQGKSVLFIHHSSKSGAQRGSSKKEDVLDTVIALRRPENYTQNQGATFEVHFEKARGFCGAEASPFEASLGQNEHGVPCWTTRSLEDSDYEKVIKLFTNGIRSQKEIVAKVGVSKATVSRYIKRARDEGVLQKEEQEEEF